jgi:hypothetical protein
MSKNNKMWLSICMGRLIKIADCRKPTETMANSFPHFFLEIGSGLVSAIDLLLLTYNRKWHTATNLLNCGGIPIPIIAASLSRYQLIGFLLSAICSRQPTIMDKPQFCLKGTVQRKLTGVVSFINREVIHSH